MSNKKQMQSAWTPYADRNHDQLVINTSFENHHLPPKKSLLIIFWLSFAILARAAAGLLGSPEFERARVLATNICAQCHLFPQPDSLDRSTWNVYVKPLMRTKMGVAALENAPSPGAHDLMEKWNAIWNDYYLVAAPEKPLPQDPRPAIVPDLNLFNVEDPRYEPSNSYATMIQIDSQTHQIYVGNAVKKALDVLDVNGRLLTSTAVDTTLTHLLQRPHGWIGTQIGIVPPNDQPLGLITLYERKENRFEKKCDLISGLLRPVHTAVADLVQPGRQDLVVCSFGNTGGCLAWYSRQGACSYAENILFDRPGALGTKILDVDHDGKPDIVVLAAQGREGVFLYHNQGSGRFVERPLIEQPPVWGYASFQLIDFNGDGYLDILTANGDRGDFACPPKKYHGIRIYLNDGNWNFKEAYFFPMNGAYKCIAGDFSGNGRLDIAAISFFPDYEKSPEESFVFLEDQGGMKFTPHTIPESFRGRWLTMDAADLDGDGDLDIVLGGAYKVPFQAPEAFLERWRKEGPSILILRNQLADRKNKTAAK